MNLTEAQAYEIDLADDASIRQKSLHELMGQCVSGIENQVTLSKIKNIIFESEICNMEKLELC